MIAAEELDFCYECNICTRWDSEQCAGCGRIWGYALGEGPCDTQEAA